MDEPKKPRVPNSGSFQKGHARGGRPTKYNEALAKEICKRLADGESLRSICRDEHIPEKITVLDWALDIKHPFASQYDRARDMQAETFADELQDISDDGQNDWMERELKNGKIIEVPDHEHINRSRLRVDTRKWIASKLKPKRYGDRLQTEHSGKLSMTYEKLLDESRKEE